MLFDDRLGGFECLSNDEETHRDDLHPEGSAADASSRIADSLTMTIPRSVTLTPVQ
jgi:hypothetical protein